jgi:hypothetical protein
MVETFPGLVIELWQLTDWGYTHVDVRDGDLGWVNYISKRRDKADFGSAIDWINFHNPV